VLTSREHSRDWSIPFSPSTKRKSILAIQLSTRTILSQPLDHYSLITESTHYTRSSLARFIGRGKIDGVPHIIGNARQGIVE
jgi:hypothetical protein